MDSTRDPLEVFRMYTEGVVIHDNKDVTISPKIQTDILDATALLLREVEKLGAVIGVVIRAIDNRDAEELVKVRELMVACLTNPEEVSFFQTNDMNEVKEIINQFEMLHMDEDEEVKH